MCYTIDSGYFLNKKVGRRSSEEADSDYLKAALMLGISVDYVWVLGNNRAESTSLLLLLLSMGSLEDE